MFSLKLSLLSTSSAWSFCCTWKVMSRLCWKETSSWLFCMKSIISVMLFMATFLAMAITQFAGGEMGVSVSLVMRQTVICDDTTASGISNPGATQVGDEIGSLSIHGVSTWRFKTTGISLDVYASTIWAWRDFTSVDHLGGGLRS